MQTADPGTPAYSADGYAEPGWQLRTGEMIEAVAGEVAYGDLSGTAIADDGIDFFGLAPADVIRRSRSSTARRRRRRCSTSASRTFRPRSRR